MARQLPLQIVIGLQSMQGIGYETRTKASIFLSKYAVLVLPNNIHKKEVSSKGLVSSSLSIHCRSSTLRRSWPVVSHGLSVIDLENNS